MKSSPPYFVIKVTNLPISSRYNELINKTHEMNLFMNNEGEDE